MLRHNTKSSTIILILGSLTAISPFAIDMYLPAFAQIATDLGTTTVRMALSVASYFLGLAVGQMMYGPLLDRFGRKRPMFAGMTLFMIACFGCMSATTIESLVAWRFVQAIGGCVAWIGAMAMVRDFFPARESARVFSLLVLILGVSPLLAPTTGGFMATWLGWRWIFAALAALVAINMAFVFFLLPEGHQPDKSISLKPVPILKTFLSIVRNTQFITYTLAGSLSFAMLFIHVSASPVVFMDGFKLSPQAYGGMFALCAAGFIGESQANIFILRTRTGDVIFRYALLTQMALVLLFLLLTWLGWIGLAGTATLLILSLFCIGVLNPNAGALALAPFDRNVGSAAALLGSIQIAIGGLVSTVVGNIHSGSLLPMVELMTATTALACLVLWIGSRQMGPVVMGENTPEAAAH